MRMKIKILRSKSSLMDTLVHLMREKEFSTISITEICTKAGYNRGTFYKHYYDKQQLLDDLIQLKLDELKNQLEHVEDKWIKDGHDLEKNMQNVLVLFDYIYENRFFLDAVLKTNKVKGYRFRLYEAFKTYWIRLQEKELEEIKEDEFIEQCYIDYITSTWFGVALYWINEVEHKDSTYVAQQCIKILNETNHKIFTNRWEFNTINSRQEETDKRIIRTKEAFENALLCLMMKKNYKDIKIIDILKEVEYNKSTFYAHYKDKDALYDSIRKNLVQGMFQAFRGAHLTYSEKQSQTVTPVHRLFHFIYQNQTLLQIMHSDMAVPGFFNKLFTEIQHIFYEELKGRTHIDEEIYSNYITVTLMNLASAWFTSGLRYSPNYIADIYLKFVGQVNENASS